MIVRARAPLRLGLAGGGTDVSPYCDQYGGYVLNATIDRYAYAVIKTREDPVVRFAASDQQREDVLPVSEALTADGTLALHRAAYREVIQLYNGGKAIPLEMETFCDAPPGSGLGSSSTLVVAMVRALAELLNIPLDDYALAQLAFRIERIDWGLQGGGQDEYSAAFGGFNFMEFYGDERAIVNQLRIKNWVICNLEAGQEGALEAMHNIKREALVMKECLLKGNFEGIVESMRWGWASKKRLAETVSPPHIEEIYRAAVEAGALAGRVSGAGGGGFIMFFVPPDRRMDVVRALDAFHGQVSNCHFTKYGAQA